MIKVSRAKAFLDIPDRRKIHLMDTPSLGGIAIFIGLFTALVLYTPLSDIIAQKYMLSGVFLIFVLGVSDDLTSINAFDKLVVQTFAAFIVVNLGHISLTGFYGILGFETINPILAQAISIFIIVALTNSFNLIDGIDGLAGGIGLIILTMFGWLFLINNELAFAAICLSMAGALIAFLFFNWAPAKIFMGDTGSMLTGFMVSTLAIHFINIGHTLPEFNSWISLKPSVGIAVTALILPIYDTIRIFIIRLKQGKSPFDPDRNHIHHGLLRLGFNHANAALILIGINSMLILFAMGISPYVTNNSLLVIVFSAAIGFGLFLDLKLKMKKNQYLLNKKELNPTLYVSKSA